MAEYQMSSLVGKNVHIDRGGPESRSGVVLGVGSDYLILSTKAEGIIYYYLNHIKSITIAKNQFYNEVAAEQINVPSQPELLIAGSMKEVFEKMKYHQIQINRGGPERVKGVLTEIFDDYLTLVAKGEVLLVLYYHIKNCSFFINNPAEEGKQENADAAAQNNAEAKAQGDDKANKEDKAKSDGKENKDDKAKKDEKSNKDGKANKSNEKNDKNKNKSNKSKSSNGRSSSSRSSTARKRTRSSYMRRTR